MFQLLILMRVTTTYQKLSDSEIKSEVSKLQGWKIVNGKLSKSFQFKNFVEVFSFMTKVATEAEEMNHYREWFNVYNKLTINLVTHDVDGIINYDVISNCH